MTMSTGYHRFCWFFLLLLLLTGGASSSTSSSSSVGGSFGLQAAVSQIPRGGGWFGGGNNRNNNNNSNKLNKRKNGRRTNNRRQKNAGFGGGGGDGGGGGNRRYPSLTQAEIIEKLNVPVFAITDKLGNSIVARAADEEEHVQYLFLSQKMAQQALESIQRNKTITGENNEVQLKLLSLHLGKMWFRYLQNETEANTLYELKTPHTNPQQQPQTQPSTHISMPTMKKKKVIFRLVPDARNLISARLMTTINPEEMQEAMATGDQNEIQSLVQKATLQGKNFTSPFNEIPLFLIPTMRAQKTVEENNSGENANKQVSSPQQQQQQQPQLKMPIFLGAKDLVHAFMQQQKDMQMAFNANNNPNKPQQFTTKVSVTSLHSLVEMMQHESDFDFRSIIIFPLNEEDDESNNNNDDDDDNDGGGGDFGISASQPQPAQEEMEPQIEMFTSFATNDGSWMDQDNGYYQQTLSM